MAIYKMAVDVCPICDGDTGSDFRPFFVSQVDGVVERIYHADCVVRTIMASNVSENMRLALEDVVNDLSRAWAGFDKCVTMYNEAEDRDEIPLKGVVYP